MMLIFYNILIEKEELVFMGKKKGRLQEILSKAIYADNPDIYTISYRDFDTILSIPLLKFMEISQNFEIIPATRIIQVKKGERILYEKRIVGIKKEN